MLILSILLILRLRLALAIWLHIKISVSWIRLLRIIIWLLRSRLTKLIWLHNYIYLIINTKVITSVRCYNKVMQDAKEEVRGRLAIEDIIGEYMHHVFLPARHHMYQRKIKIKRNSNF